MANYLAMRIIAGKLDYAAVFSIELYKQFKEEVDNILKAQGRQNLIVKI